MKKLSAKLKNTPMDTQLVPCSVSPTLNREETLSVQDRPSAKLTDNTSEVDQPQIHTGGQKVSVVVYVLNKDGKPLMPASPRKAKKLLKGGLAHVVKRAPFTIQLDKETTPFVQDITLGIDTGYGHIGFSATTEKKEVIAGEVKLDDKTKERLTERKMYRRGRRNKLWYREPRFNNRATPKGWLPPSVQRRYETHINLVKKIKQILPITKVIVEVGNFDIQKLDNPDIQGKDYQQGDMAGYLNAKAFLIAREKGKCQICGKEKGTDKWATHHINQRKNTGTDKPSNLALLHKKCHEKLHKDGSKLKVEGNKGYKPSTFMNIVKGKFQKDLGCDTTYGYITQSKRYELGLDKTHINDAFAIGRGGNQQRCNPFGITQRHRNNRVLQLNRKGFKPSIREKRYKIQVGDLFWVGNKEYASKGVKNSGKYILYGSDKKKEYFKIGLVEKVYNQGSLAWK